MQFECECGFQTRKSVQYHEHMKKCIQQDTMWSAAQILTEGKPIVGAHSNHVMSGFEELWTSTLSDRDDDRIPGPPVKMDKPVPMTRELLKWLISIRQVIDQENSSPRQTTSTNRENMGHIRPKLEPSDERRAYLPQ